MTDPPGLPVSGQYQPLQKYLAGRYADTVVLTFSQIEDLIGCPLPEAAALHQDWWSSAASDGTVSEQSKAWTQAKRTAAPRLGARVVLFARVPA